MVACISNINVVEVIWHALCWCCVFILSRVWKLDENLVSGQVNGYNLLAKRKILLQCPNLVYSGPLLIRPFLPKAKTFVN
jgi:hypothetical protein